MCVGGRLAVRLFALGQPSSRGGHDSCAAVMVPEWETSCEACIHYAAK